MKRLLLISALLNVWICRAASEPIEQYDPAVALIKVQRIYVEKLGGGETSDQMRDILIAALQNSGLFAVTENPERADTMVRGSSDDTTFVNEHHTSETLGVHTQGGSSQSGKGTKSYMGAGLTDNETSNSNERRHEASASVRLVNLNGDVIWSTTQESSGGRFRGAMADIADKIVRRLGEDIAKARRLASSPPEKTN